MLRFDGAGDLDGSFGSGGRADLPQVAAQVLNPEVSIPFPQIHVIVGHTQTGDNGVDLLRVAN